MAAIETGHDLIGSDRVSGTSVHGQDGNKIGSIERVMIEKRTGRVAYAVLAFGGFLGVGTYRYPLAWDLLNYDPELGGYRTSLDESQLTDAPHYAQDEDWDWNDPAKAKAVDAYYTTADGVLGLPPIGRI